LERQLVLKYLDPRIKFNSLSEIKQQARNYFRRLLFLRIEIYEPKLKARHAYTPIIITVKTKTAPYWKCKDTKRLLDLGVISEKKINFKAFKVESHKAI